MMGGEGERRRSDEERKVGGGERTRVEEVEAV